VHQVGDQPRCTVNQSSRLMEVIISNNCLNLSPEQLLIYVCPNDNFPHFSIIFEAIARSLHPLWTVLPHSFCVVLQRQLCKFHLLSFLTSHKISCQFLPLNSDYPFSTTNNKYTHTIRISAEAEMQC